MLLVDTVQFCDKMYSSFGNNCGCEGGICNNPSGRCSGNCYNCLYHIHYPSNAPQNAKTDYDCGKMLYHYVCQYSYLYTTELLCAFEHEWSFIKCFPYFHVLSLGCGGCADLMALEILRQRKNCITPVSYLGFDKNELWSPIHKSISEYCDKNNLKFKPCYYDVFDYFSDRSIIDSNIIVISYLISHLYNTDQISEINKLAENLAETISKKGTPLLLIINDVNSCYRGRDHFRDFIAAIRKSGLTVAKSEYKYFDAGNLVTGQKLGSPYDLHRVPFIIPSEIQRKYHANDSINQTVQLLVEVS